VTDIVEKLRRCGLRRDEAAVLSDPKYLEVVAEAQSARDH
jgi:hypothetical protein